MLCQLLESSKESRACYPCFTHSRAQQKSLSEGTCYREEPGPISSSSSCAVTKPRSISAPCLGRLQPLSLQRCQHSRPRIPSANSPSVPATYTIYSACQAISSEQHVATLGWRLSKAARSLVAESVLSGGAFLHCLMFAGRRGAPSQHPPAALCSQTGATGGQKNEQ